MLDWWYYWVDAITWMDHHGGDLSSWVQAIGTVAAFFVGFRQLKIQGRGLEKEMKHRDEIEKLGQLKHRELRPVFHSSSTLIPAIGGNRPEYSMTITNKTDRIYYIESPGSWIEENWSTPMTCNPQELGPDSSCRAWIHGKPAIGGRAVLQVSPRDFECPCGKPQQGHWEVRLALNPTA